LGFIVKSAISNKEKKMMNELEKERFENKVCVGEILISSDAYSYPQISHSAAEIKLIVPEENYDAPLDLYYRLCHFSKIHGKDLQDSFHTDQYYYMSCFIHDVDAFKNEFSGDEQLKPLFNPDRGVIKKFIISFPKRTNYDGKEAIHKSFIEIIQSHVITIDDDLWKSYISRALTGDTEFECSMKERRCIQTLSRKNFVKKNIVCSFEPEYYVSPFIAGAVKIGAIDNHPVFFNPKGLYIYWNRETEYVLDSWLTYPAIPL
jgi:hypothetical protein